MATTKKVEKPNRPTKGVEVYGIRFFPEQMKQYKSVDEFVNAHKTLRAFKLPGKPAADEKAAHNKKVTEKLTDVWNKLVGKK